MCNNIEIDETGRIFPTLHQVKKRRYRVKPICIFVKGNRTYNYKNMNTGNIKSCQVTLLMDDDTAVIGTTDDVVVLNVIASFVKFVKIDREKVTQIKLKDLI